MDGNDVTLIAGATASGKSEAALALAEQTGAVIINADSMQVYADLRVLTARPSAADEARLPHRLYGHVPASKAYSVAQWLEDLEAELAVARDQGQQVIIVGGTGLFFKALLEGLSPIPGIPEAIRRRWRLAGSERDAKDLHGELALRDPDAAQRIRASDTQRVVRALEVIDATDRSIVAWQGEPGTPLLNSSGVRRLLKEKPREVLYDKADARLDRMLEDGALDEVEALRSQNLSPELPAMRAVGVPPLLAHVRGELSREDALQTAKRDTRHYIKRQITWQRRYMNAWDRL